MTERDKLHKKTLLLNYAERIGMEVLKDYGSWLAVGFPVEPIKLLDTTGTQHGTIHHTITAPSDFITPNRKAHHGQH